MPIKYYCNNCNDKGIVGLLRRDDWLFRLIELWFDPPESWMERTCPKCNGNPRSQLPKRPAVPPAPPPPKRD